MTEAQRPLKPIIKETIKLVLLQLLDMMAIILAFNILGKKYYSYKAVKIEMCEQNASKRYLQLTQAFNSLGTNGLLIFNQEKKGRCALVQY